MSKSIIEPDAFYPIGLDAIAKHFAGHLQMLAMCTYCRPDDFSMEAAGRFLPESRAKWAAPGQTRYAPPRARRTHLKPG